MNSVSSSDDDEYRGNDPIRLIPWLINVPDERTHAASFEGRDGCVEAVAKMLSKDSIGAICGQAGIGKTTVAAKLVHQLKQSVYKLVLWINCASDETFVESVSKISDEVCTRSSFQIKLPATGDFRVYEKLEGVKRWIRLKSDDYFKILFVFDGCDELAMIKKVYKLLPEHGLSSNNVHALFTSKIKTLDSVNIYKTYTLEPLDDDVVVKLLIDRARSAGVKWKSSYDGVEKKAAEKINELVRGVPLGVEQVTAYIQTRKLKLSQYLKEYSRSDSETLPVEFPFRGNQQANIYQVYERNFRETSKDSCVREIMGIVAFCGVGLPIPMQLFSLGSKGLHERYSLRKLFEAPKEGGVRQKGDSLHVPVSIGVPLSKLEQYHLVNVDTENDAFSVHPLIQHLLFCRQEEKDRLESIGALSTMLSKVLEGSPLDRWQLYSKLFPHVMKCYRRMNDMTVYDINFLLQSGKRLALVGHFQESIKLLEDCLSKIRQNVREHKTMNEGETLLELGSAKRRLGKFSEATECTRLALEIWRRLPSSPRVSNLQARTKEVVAEIHLDLNEFQQAENLLKEVEPLIVSRGDVTESNDMSDIFEQASCFGNLGRACFGQGKYDEAIEMFQKAESVLQKANYFRFHLYKAHRLVATARKAMEMHYMDVYHRTFKQCIRVRKEIEKHYNARHRYYAWFCREISTLRLKEAENIKAADDKLRKMKLALKLCQTSLQCHLDLYKEKHQKVAKAAEVAARVCLEYSQCDVTSDKVIEFRIVTVRCLQLAIRIWKDTHNEMKQNSSTVVERKIAELQALEAETRDPSGNLNVRLLTLERSRTKDEGHDTLYMADNAVQALNFLTREDGSNYGSTNLTAVHVVGLLYLIAVVTMLIVSRATNV